MSKYNIYLDKRVAEYHQVTDLTVGTVPERLEWFHFTAKPQVITLSFFAQKGDDELPIFIETKTESESSTETFTFFVPSFSFYSRTILGKNTSTDIYHSLKLVWRRYCKLAKLVYMNFSSQCKIKFDIGNYKQTSAMNLLKFLSQTDEKIVAIEREMIAMDDNFKEIESDIVSIEVLFNSILNLEEKYRFYKEKKEQLGDVVNSNLKFLSELKSEKKVSELQIMQQQAEFEQVYSSIELKNKELKGLLTKQINVEEEIKIQTKEQSMESESDNNIASLRTKLEIAHLQISQLQEEVECYFSLYNSTPKTVRTDYSRNKSPDTSNDVKSKASIKLINSLLTKPIK